MEDVDGKEHLNILSFISIFIPETRKSSIKSSRIRSTRLSVSHRTKYSIPCNFLDHICIISDKIIGTTALSKHYCQYRKDQNLLRMINFTQTSTKQVLN